MHVPRLEMHVCAPKTQSTKKQSSKRSRNAKTKTKRFNENVKRENTPQQKIAFFFIVGKIAEKRADFLLGCLNIEQRDMARVSHCKQKTVRNIYTRRE